MKTSNPLAKLASLLLLAASIVTPNSSVAASLLMNFPFNEGKGSNTVDTVYGLVGKFGLQDPAVDYVSLTDFSPSGQPGDRSITNAGLGFLVADDSVNPVLDITNGPITLEAWVFLDPSYALTAKTTYGLIGYGNSFKMGLRGPYQVFTLFGIKDITNSIPDDTVSTPVPGGEWVHLAAAWEPGVGVHFYMNGVESFVPYTDAASARPVQNNYLSIMAEGLANNTPCAMDRVRVHAALLDATMLDSDATSPKAPLASTLVAYNFNETSLPAQSAVAPARPAIQSAELLKDTATPEWSSDTPTGLPNDYSLTFNLTNPVDKEKVTALYNGQPANPSATYSLEAWVKLPQRFINDRMVVFRTTGTAPRLVMSIAANRTMHTTILGNKDYASSVQVPNDDRWHHVAVTMDNLTTLKFYLDGLLRETQTASTTLPTGDSAAPGLMVGMESATRFYQGLLDRVRIHEGVLEPAELDYPAIPGLPTFTQHPAAVLTGVTSNVTFTVAANSATSYAWYYRTNLADKVGRLIEGATTTTLNLSDVDETDTGFYYAVASNGVGSTESYAAQLLVKKAPGTLERLWSVLPGSRPYITGYSSSASTRDLERGMAYNPLTKHLIVGSRVNSPVVRGIYIVDAETGAHVGELPGVVNFVTNGTICLTRIAVADDGAIYACNFGATSADSTNDFKIYRWANETATPTVAYKGNPVAGIAGHQQWGKHMIVRGTGVGTQLIVPTTTSTATSILALFTTTDGQNFTPTILNAGGRPSDWSSALTFGQDDTFWAKNESEPFVQFGIHPETNGAPLLKSVYDVPRDTSINLSFSPDGKYLAGLFVQTGADVVDLYDTTNPEKPILLDTGVFDASNNHTVGYGNVIFVGDKLYALEPNNGIMAFKINAATTTAPTLGARMTATALEIFWPASETGFVLESIGDLKGTTWTVVPHTTVGAENVATISTTTPQAQFFRLKK